MIQNVVFMGTPDFAVGTLEALIDSGKYCVKAVFSQPDRPKGRRQELQPTPVKETAARAGIPVYQPERIRDPQWTELLNELRPDVIVVVAFGQIIPQVILDLPPYGCINVHASLLPKYRGAAPIQWAVIRGEKESGVTTMRMDAGLDTGDMILRETVPLEENETAGSLFDRLSRVGASLLLQTLDVLADGTASFERQPSESPTPYAAMLKKEDGRIDWSKSADSLECLVRGMNPWPCAWTRRNGKLLKIWAARAGAESSAEACKMRDDADSGSPETAPCKPESDAGASGTAVSAAGDSAFGTTVSVAADSTSGTAVPAAGTGVFGTVVSVTGDRLLVQTGDGLLSLTELQPEGKKRMAVSDYLRGYSVKEGERLG